MAYLLSLDKKELFYLLILHLKLDHLSTFSGQNVQSLAHTNMIACTSCLVLCCMYEVLCPRLAFLHCSPSYTPPLPLLWAYAWGVEQNSQGLACCIEMIWLVVYYLLSFAFNPIKCMVLKICSSGKRGV